MGANAHYKTILGSEALMIEIEWNIGYYDCGCPTLGYSPDPNKPIVFLATISTFKFQKYGKFDFFKGCKKEGLPDLPPAKTWWVDGMQSEVVTEVTLILEHRTENIYIIYNAMNDPSCPQFLGKLTESELLTTALQSFQMVKNGNLKL